MASSFHVLKTDDHILGSMPGSSDASVQQEFL